MLEIVVEQQCAAGGGPAAPNPNRRVSPHVRVLEVRLDHPTLVAVDIDHVVDRLVV